MARRPGLWTSTSMQLLIGLIIREFSSLACSMCIGDSVLSVLTQLLSIHIFRILSGESGRPGVGNVTGSVLGPLLFFHQASELFSILENKLYGYPDNSTLVAVVPSLLASVLPMQRPINRDVNIVSGSEQGCDSRERWTYHQLKVMIVNSYEVIISSRWW